MISYTLTLCGQHIIEVEYVQAGDPWTQDKPMDSFVNKCEMAILIPNDYY